MKTESLETRLRIRLEAMRSNPSEIYEGFGICSNLREIADEGSYALLADLWTKWPYFSGNRRYPVPSSNSDSNSNVKNRSFWDKNTEYGQLRWNLLDFLISELSSLEGEDNGE